MRRNRLPVIDSVRRGTVSTWLRAGYGRSTAGTIQFYSVALHFKQSLVWDIFNKWYYFMDGRSANFERIYPQSTCFCSQFASF